MQCESGDLTLPEHAQEVVNQAWEYFGQIDAVVNIAGGFVWERQAESSLDTWNTHCIFSIWRRRLW